MSVPYSHCVNEAPHTFKTTFASAPWPMLPSVMEYHFEAGGGNLVIMNNISLWHMLFLLAVWHSQLISSAHTKLPHSETEKLLACQMFHRLLTNAYLKKNIEPYLECLHASGTEATIIKPIHLLLATVRQHAQSEPFCKTIAWKKIHLLDFKKPKIYDQLALFLANSKPLNAPPHKGITDILKLLVPVIAADISTAKKIAPPPNSPIPEEELFAPSKSESAASLMSTEESLISASTSLAQLALDEKEYEPLTAADFTTAGRTPPASPRHRAVPITNPFGRESDEEFGDTVICVAHESSELNISYSSDE